MAVDSPCVDICKIVQRTGYCRGCGRTAAEIRTWQRASEAEKEAILACLPERLMAMGDFDVSASPDTVPVLSKREDRLG
jgi:predicted Fe-S protein YdhL (DUF1289 family)